MAFQVALSQQDLWDGEMKEVLIDGKRVLLVHWDRAVHAFENRCAHLGVPLSQGRLKSGILTCSAHEWQFDACTGRGINPQNTQLKQYPVEIRNDMIYVDVSGEITGGKNERP